MKLIGTFAVGTAILLASTSLTQAFEDGNRLVWVSGDKPLNAEGGVKG